MSNKPDLNKNLAQIYIDINSIKIDATDSFQTSLDKFHDVMRKWGIKKGQRTESGSVQMVTSEWNMCWAVFKQNKILALDLWLCLGDTPDDLYAYDYVPEK